MGVILSVKWVALVAFSLIFAGFSGFGIAQLIPNNSSSEENLVDNSIADSFVGKIAANSDDVNDDVISTGGDDTRWLRRLEEK